MNYYGAFKDVIGELAVFETKEQRKMWLNEKVEGFDKIPVSEDDTEAILGFPLAVADSYIEPFEGVTWLFGRSKYHCYVVWDSKFCRHTYAGGIHSVNFVVEKFADFIIPYMKYSWNRSWLGDKIKEGEDPRKLVLDALVEATNYELDENWPGVYCCNREYIKDFFVVVGENYDEAMEYVSNRLLDELKKR